MMNAFDSRRDRAQLLLLVLGIAIAFAVLPLAAGLLGALVLHVAAAPVHRRLATHLPVRSAAVLVVVATALLIFLPAAWLLAVAIDATPDALRQLTDNPTLAKLAAIRVGDLDVGTRVIDASSAIISWMSGQVFNVLGGAVRATLNGAVALFGLYFLLSAPPASWSRVAAYLPFSRDGATLLAHRFRQVTEATLLGTALTSVLQGAVVALGFAATGLSDPWFWGVVTAVVAVLPVFGSALVWVPGTIALAAQGRYGAATILALVGGGVASNIDNVMRVIVNRRVSNLHPMTTLVGAFAGVGVLGLPGILLGPLAISYFFELTALYRREFGPPDTGLEPNDSLVARSQ
jgi:predicted PurR-regulated permease PerM